MKKILLLGFSLLFTAIVFSQTTYTWKGGTSGAYGSAANWNPARNTPASNDILVVDFNNSDGSGSTPTVVGINISNITTNETIGELRLNISGTITTTGVRTLTFSGTATTLNVSGNVTMGWYTSTSYCRLADGGNTLSIGGNLATVNAITASSTLHTGAGKLLFTALAATFCTPTSTAGNVNVQNIEISGSTTLTMQGILQVNGDLKINTGGVLFQNGKGLVLQSLNGIGGTVSGDGVISASSTGAITITSSGTASATPISVGTLNFATTSAVISTINALTLNRVNATVTIGTAFNSTLIVSGTITLNAGTINDGGNTINVGGGSLFSTTNTTTGGAVYTGNGKVNYTRANVTAPSFFTSSTVGATLTVGNITWAPGSASTTNPVFNSGTNPIKVVLTGAFNFVRNGAGSPTITLNNVDSLILAPTASITIPTGLTFDFNTKPVLFQSSATSTARLGTITGTLSGATNVTVERYIPLGKRAWRLLTPSLTTSGTIRANWQNGGTLVNNLGTHITGSTTGANGFDQTISGGASLFTYDNTAGTWGVSVTNTNLNTLTVGAGYRLLVRGDRNVNLTVASQDNMNDYTVLRTTGTVVNGTGAAPADAGSGGVLPSLNGTVGNFSLVGNPFISPIDWHTITRSTGLEDAYYVWDPNLGTTSQRGRYVSYSVASGQNNTGNTGASNIGRYIQPGQAFFVKTTGASPSITIKESDKASTFVSVFRTQNSFNNLTVALFEPNELASGFPIDAATSVFGSNFTQGVDTGDVEKFYSAGENISFKEGTSYLMINARPTVNNNDTMHLQITNLLSTGKDYAFKINATDFSATNQAYLLDAYLQTTQSLNLNGSSVINFSTVNGINASYADNRFSIVFKTTGALPVSITSLKAYQKNTGINVEWNVVNEINMNNYEVEKSTDGKNFNRAGTVAAIGSSTYNWFDASPINGNNFYRIKMMDKNGATRNSQVVNVKIGGDKNIFTVIGNPVKTKAVLLQMENVEKGNYKIAVYNNIGQQVTSKTIIHNGGSAIETIGLGSIASGTYQLSVLGANGTRFIKILLVD